MGESIQGLGAIVVIGGACFTMYCVVQAKNVCETAYPASGGPQNDRKRMLCISQRLKFCVTFGFYIMDPIGSAASTVGQEAGKNTKR